MKKITNQLTTTWTPILGNSGDIIKFTDIRLAAQTCLSLQAKEALQHTFNFQGRMLAEMLQQITYM